MTTDISPHIWLNGKLVQQADAVIPISDRGFRFGDGVFETIRLHNGIPYQWDLHIARLYSGLKALRISLTSIPSLPKSASNYISLYELLLNEARILISKNGADTSDHSLRIAISRGSGSKGFLPIIDDNIPTLIMETSPLPINKKNNVQIHISSICRIPTQCLPTHAKLAQGLNNTLARLEAKDNLADEALMLTPDGFIAECSAANIFWIKDNILYTPELKTGCLPGTTRSAVMRLFQGECKEVLMKCDALLSADEVFITNTGWKISPVQSIVNYDREWVLYPITNSLQQRLDNDIQHYAVPYAHSVAAPS